MDTIHPVMNVKYQCGCGFYVESRESNPDFSDERMIIALEESFRHAAEKGHSLTIIGKITAR